jgi:hypothetical protein
MVVPIPTAWLIEINRRAARPPFRAGRVMSATAVA